MTKRDSRGGQGGPVAIGDTGLIREFEKRARQQMKPPTPAQQRLIEAASLADEDAALALLYQHSALCQTFLPYRNPGDDTRTWERVNGKVHLEILAGKALHPVEERFTPVGLPFGPKARLVLMYINQQALLAKSPEIEVQDSLTAFVRRSLKLDPGGRTIRTVKDQLARLSAASIRLGLVRDGRAMTVNSQIVTAFDIWFPKDERQRVLWPSTVHLSLDYWESQRNNQPAVLGELSPGDPARRGATQRPRGDGRWQPRRVGQLGRLADTVLAAPVRGPRPAGAVARPRSRGLGSGFVGHGGGPARAYQR